MSDPKRQPKIVVVGFLAVCGAALLTNNAAAQASRSVRDGIYTEAQAQRGAGQYAQHCAMCHGAALGGNGEAPPLIGEFIRDWDGATLDQLFDKISVTMPLNRPGSLRPAANADILAFLLKSNNFPAGTAELGPDAETLKTVRFQIPDWAHARPDIRLKSQTQ